MFTKDEVARRSYEKAEKFRRDQAAQIRYVKEEGIKAMIITQTSHIENTNGSLKTVYLKR